MTVFCQNVTYNNYKIAVRTEHAQFMQENLSERTGNMSRICNFVFVYRGEISQWNHVDLKNAILLLPISNSILQMHKRTGLVVWLNTVIEWK
jgi:hypothetical protein